MADWGICATVKAQPDQVLAFVAHHLGLGANRIWLFFDDPSDPGIDAVHGLPAVTATRCDDAYWSALCKTRPEAHQNRQSRNMRHVYDMAVLPWVAHLDVDEFLWPVQDIARLLDDQPADRIVLRMAPWEALHDPALADDIFTARQFRAALKGPLLSEARSRAFGRYADILTEGVLSHAAGKCFFQRGFAGLQPRLHGAFRDGKRIRGGDMHPDIAVLHFHAEHPARWKDRLPFRLTRGAYQFNAALQARLLAADAAGIDAFYQAVQNPSANQRAFLAGHGLLMSADLDLRRRVAALQYSIPPKAPPP